MLRIHSLKSALAVYLFTLIVLIFLSSCGSRSTSAEAQGERTTPVVSTKENDQKFIQHAIDLYFEEIILGKLARQKTVSAEVQELAKMLEENSRAAKSELASMAIMKSIAISGAPPAVAQATYDLLSQVTDQEFDTGYTRRTVEKLQEAVRLFETASTSALDPDILSKASAALPVLRDQLAKAISLEGNMSTVAEVAP